MLKKQPFWTTNSFSKLAAKWEAKLVKSGFKDAESTIKGVRVLTTSSNSFRDSATEAVKEAKADYYRTMGQYLWTMPFDTKLDKYVITEHVNGVTIKDICIGLKLKGFGRNRQGRERRTVYRIIRKYETRWDVR